MKRENTCFDLGAHAEVLNKQGENGQAALKHRYKRFILMNASIRGPFVPHWSKECWSEAYLGKVNERVKVSFYSFLLRHMVGIELMSDNTVSRLVAQLHGRLLSPCAIHDLGHRLPRAQHHPPTIRNR